MPGGHGKRDGLIKALLTRQADKSRLLQLHVFFAKPPAASRAAAERRMFTAVGHEKPDDHFTLLCHNVTLPLLDSVQDLTNNRLESPTVPE
jgi:hypothetical protein